MVKGRGVCFAEKQSDDYVGYKLTASEQAEEIKRINESKGERIPILLEHEGNMLENGVSTDVKSEVIGYVTSAYETPEGNLGIEYEINPSDNIKATKAVMDMRKGDLNGMSIGMECLKEKADGDIKIRDKKITEISLTKNPDTKGTSIDYLGPDPPEVNMTRFYMMMLGGRKQILKNTEYIPDNKIPINTSESSLGHDTGESQSGSSSQQKPQGLSSELLAVNPLDQSEPAVKIGENMDQTKTSPELNSDAQQLNGKRKLEDDNTLPKSDEHEAKRREMEKQGQSNTTSTTRTEDATKATSKNDADLLAMLEQVNKQNEELKKVLQETEMQKRSRELQKKQRWIEKNLDAESVEYIAQCMGAKANKAGFKDALETIKKFKERPQDFDVEQFNTIRTVVTASTGGRSRLSEKERQLEEERKAVRMEREKNEKLQRDIDEERRRAILMESQERLRSGYQGILGSNNNSSAYAPTFNKPMGFQTPAMSSFGSQGLKDDKEGLSSQQQQQQRNNNTNAGNTSSSGSSGSFSSFSSESDPNLIDGVIPSDLETPIFGMPETRGLLPSELKKSDMWARLSSATGPSKKPSMFNIYAGREFKRPTTGVRLLADSTLILDLDE